MITVARYCVPSWCLLVLLTICASPLWIVSATVYPDQVGPLADKVVYKVIDGDDTQLYALLNDDIDLIGDTVYADHISTLQAAEDIDVVSTPRNGYGYFVINTVKYPLNITGFRRAFAFALDKQAISDTLFEGHAVPQDSCVPRCNPWSVEGQLPYTYYESDAATGNYLLDQAGFIDVDADGWREAPDGTDFNITIQIPNVSSIEVYVGDYAEDAFQALHINATAELADVYDYVDRIYSHRDYAMAYLRESFTHFDVDWLAYEYWSEYADEPYWNIPRWRNATYDGWRNQLLHSTDYDEVYQAAIEMQRILAYDCPVVVCHEFLQYSAYRTDRFEGFVNDVEDGVPGWWTNYRVRLKDSMEGTLRRSMPLDVDTFNFMSTTSSHTASMLYNLYDSLIVRKPNGRDIPWLAENYSIQASEDDSSIAAGHTRITFDIVRNATWTDGYPLTAEDVAFTFNYYYDGMGNPFGADLIEMTAAYAPSTYRAVFEFSTESYWHLHTVGYDPIIPKHIFYSSSPDNWSEWNPSPPQDEMVTSGPFTVSDYVEGVSCELTCNANYFHRTPHATSNSTDPDGYGPALPILSTAMVAGSSIVISIVVIDTLRRRRSVQVQRGGNLDQSRL